MQQNATVAKFMQLLHLFCNSHATVACKTVKPLQKHLKFSTALCPRFWKSECQIDQIAMLNGDRDRVMP